MLNKSQERGYGEAGGEGVVFFVYQERIPHPPLHGPPSPASGRGLLSTDISRSDLNVEIPGPRRFCGAGVGFQTRRAELKSPCDSLRLTQVVQPSGLRWKNRLDFNWGPKLPRSERTR